jgi:hypothetical protein
VILGCDWGDILVALDLKQLVDVKSAEVDLGDPENWRQGRLKASAARAQAQERLRLRQQVCGVCVCVRVRTCVSWCMRVCLRVRTTLSIFHTYAESDNIEAECPAKSAPTGGVGNQ